MNWMNSLSRIHLARDSNTGFTDKGSLHKYQKNAVRKSSDRHSYAGIVFPFLNPLDYEKILSSSSYKEEWREQLIKKSRVSRLPTPKTFQGKYSSVNRAHEASIIKGSV